MEKVVPGIFVLGHGPGRQVDDGVAAPGQEVEQLDYTGVVVGGEAQLGEHLQRVRLVLRSTWPLTSLWVMVPSMSVMMRRSPGE